MSFNEVDSLVAQAIAEGVFPGAAYAVGHKGKVVHSHAQGRHTYCPESLETTTDTIWDLASVSKVVGTTSAAMILFDQGKLDFNQPVAEILPDFGQNDKSKITIRNLLLHNSGLIAFRGYQLKYKTPEECIAAIYAEKLVYPTGTKMIYSDLGMIVFGKIIEAISGRTFTSFLNEQVFQPLGMEATQYNPVAQLRCRCAPTEPIEPWRQELRKLRGTDTEDVRKLERQPDGTNWIQGEVHDPNAELLAGVAGHAGLFSDLADLCKFMNMMLSHDNHLIKPSTVEMFIKRQTEQSSRGLGWDTKEEKSSAGKFFSMKSFGHTGYTGTSVWGDPENDTFAILLTNRVHPTSENTKIIAFRPKFHDAVYRTVHD